MSNDVIHNMARAIQKIDRGGDCWRDISFEEQLDYMAMASAALKEVFHGVDEYECEMCGGQIIVGTGTGRRNTARFCTPKCRKRYHRLATKQKP
jgi:predicted RNA-binding Zn-ribbon protein involved in translation (DUF1610 family)